MAHLRVVFHYEQGGKMLDQYGRKQANVSAALTSGAPDGDPRPDPNAITTVLSNNGFVTPPGATLVIESIANIDLATPVLS